MSPIRRILYKWMYWYIYKIIKRVAFSDKEFVFTSMLPSKTYYHWMLPATSSNYHCTFTSSLTYTSNSPSSRPSMAVVTNFIPKNMRPLQSHRIASEFSSDRRTIGGPIQYFTYSTSFSDENYSSIVPHQLDGSLWSNITSTCTYMCISLYLYV